MATEREAKFEVALGFEIPDLEKQTGVAVRPTGQQLLEATYYDTRGLYLARWGVTLRHRGTAGSPGKWTVKLPSKANPDPGVVSRTEFDFPGSPDEIPDDAVVFLRDHTRGRRLREICRLKTTRRRSILVAPGASTAFAELDDDTVEFETAAGAAGTFREIEIELLNGSDESTLRTLGEALTNSGAQRGRGEPKVLRAIKWVPPSASLERLGPDSTVIELTTHAIERSLQRFLEHVPLIRTTEEAEPVHQARVATRRLRSDLSTLRSMLKRSEERRMQSELRTLGRRLGQLRDADVMEEQLRKSVSNLSADEQREAAVYVARLHNERQAHRARLIAHLDTQQYFKSLDRLIESLDRPPVARSRLRAKDVVPSLVRRRWIRLSRRVDRLGKDPKDRKLHRVRIDAKRCRYAAELAAPVIGKDASRLASALAEVQTTLGELQDAAVLEGWLTRTAAELPSKQAAVGNALIEQQRQVARSARNAWDDNWHVIVDRGLATWLERP